MDIGVKGLCPRIYVPPCVPALIWNVNSWSQMRMWSLSFSVTAERDSLVPYMHAVGRSEVVDDVVGARVDDGVVAADAGCLGTMLSCRRPIWVAAASRVAATQAMSRRSHRLLGRHVLTLIVTVPAAVVLADFLASKADAESACRERATSDQSMPRSSASAVFTWR